MKKILAASLLYLVIIITPLSRVQGQCAMCKAVAVSNIESKSNAVGKGINKGVLYLLPVPYLLLLTGVIVWWRNSRKKITNQSKQPSSL